MSVTLGFGLISLLCFLLTFLITFEIGKIVKGRKEELEQVIRVLERDKTLTNELKMIKSYEVTIEARLSQIEKVLIKED